MVVSLLSFTAEAAESVDVQPFIGLKGGWQLADDNTYQHTDPDNYIFGLYGGFQLTPSWSWDIGYQYQGKLKADATNVSVKTDMIESAIRYDWSFTDNMSLYGRLGMAYWDMDKTQKLTVSDKGLSPLGELGVNYQLTPNVFLNAGYQYINKIGSETTGEYNSHSLLVGVSYRFGGQDNIVVVPPKTTSVIEVVPVTYLDVMESRLLTSVKFGFDESSVSQETDSQISEVLLLLKTYPQARIEIVGYTDPKGPTLYNIALSTKRAEQVALLLENNGIDVSRMDVRGEGKVTLATNALAEEYAKSRRVDIQLLSFEYEVTE